VTTTSDLANGGFDAWNAAYPAPAHGDSPPSLTPTSVFLYEDVLSHVLQQTRWAGWQWCDSPRHLAGLLLHVTLPDLAAWWFDESSYHDERVRRPLREAVDTAAEANDEDRNFFLRIADDLEAVLAGPDPVNFAEIASVVERITARFGEASRWNFTLEAFPNTVAAGTELMERTDGITHPETGADIAQPGWLELCARAGTDPASSELVVAVFQEDFSV
jgi:hypothetical protein